MQHNAATITRIYLILQFGTTLAASLIWGINTLFLLSAGLTNFEAFLANSLYTLGMVVFEIPTGIVADSQGRRTSFLLGTATLAVATAGYFALWAMHAPFWEWAVASILLGLGFTFFSGAVEAWLIDALNYYKFTGSIDGVFAKAQVVSGIAMLIGTVSGGVIAQLTTLGAPFLVRTGILLLLFALAWFLMHDTGFTPEQTNRPLEYMQKLLRRSVDNSLKIPPVRWLMVSSIFLSGVGFYIFYALQPFLLELYGDKTAYLIAGLAAALVAVAQICGGLLAGQIAKLTLSRAATLTVIAALSSVTLIGLFLANNFTLALVLIFVWGLLFAAATPVRQAYLIGMIPSRQRATVLSFDSLIGSTGSVAIQPILGRTADISTYGGSFLIGSIIQLVALPMLMRSRAAHHPSGSPSTRHKGRFHSKK